MKRNKLGTLYTVLNPLKKYVREHKELTIKSIDHTKAGTVSVLIQNKNRMLDVVVLPSMKIDEEYAVSFVRKLIENAEEV